MAEARKTDDETPVEGAQVKHVTQEEFEKLQETDPRINDASRRLEKTPLVIAPIIAVDGKPSPHKEDKKKKEATDGSRPLTSAEIASRKLGVFAESDKYADETIFAAENDPLVNQHAGIRRKPGPKPKHD